jgi:hypothetical protein
MIPLQQEIDHKTTRISDDTRPLEVEYNAYYGGRFNGDAHTVRSWQKVTLTIPASAYARRTRILDLSPQAALNLLAWLEAERETLQRLVREEEQTWDETWSKPHVQAGLAQLAEVAKQQYAAGETEEGGFGCEEGEQE